jgi:mannose-6-phosphate isomerase-like protein (cupin superfamily)
MTKDYRIERWTKEKLAPDAAEMKRQMEREGYRVFRWSDPPSAIYSMHKHGEDQSHWIISGMLELTIETVGTFVLKAGDRDFMPAGTAHSARVVSREPVVYLIGERL